MRVTYFHRKATTIHYSLEQLFEGVRSQLPASITPKVWISPYYSIGIWPRLKMVLNAHRHQSDINHITGDIHFIALGLKKKRTILTIHDLGILNNSNNLLARWILKTFWITLPVKRVTLVTVVSEATKQELLKVTNISPNKVRVIGNFIPNTFSANSKAFNTIEPRILHIGSAYNKNLNRLIEALIGVKCHLVIIGHPSNEQKVALHSNHISHEIVSGLTEEELINQYRKCDILSFISLLEGFGLPILEAQAIGRVVVTSNISSMPEVAGDGACFVDPTSVNSMRTGIVKVINDDFYRETLIQNGFKNTKRFSIEEVAKQYSELYEEVFSRSK